MWMSKYTYIHIYMWTSEFRIALTSPIYICIYIYAYVDVYVYIYAYTYMDLGVSDHFDIARPQLYKPLVDILRSQLATKLTQCNDCSADF